MLIAYVLNYFKVSNAIMYLNNAFMLITFVFAIIGLSLVEFYLKKKSVTKGLRILIYFFLIGSPL